MSVHYITEPGVELQAALSFLGAQKILSVDIESSGFDPLSNKVLLLQIGNRYHQYVFDIARLGDAVQQVKPILVNPAVLKILHNGKFDYKFLKANLGIEMETIYDTMLAEHLLQKGRKMSGFALDDVSEKYANVKLDKTIRQTFGGLVYGETFSQEQIEYAAADVRFLELIMIEQRKLLQRDLLEEVCSTECNAIQVTGDMELNGMRIDRTKWLAAEAITKVERQAALDQLDILVAPFVTSDMFGKPELNYNSPKQLLAVLQRALPEEKITATGEDALKDIHHPITEALLYYRGLEKRITTYGEAFLKNIHNATGRVHTTFDQSETDTGRYSSKKPNLQNIPVKDTSIYRDAFIAFDDDSMLVDADYSNMELRILADLSGEPKWREIFEKGLDMHCEIGSMLFGKPIRQKGTLGPDDPGENAELRKIVKSINFGVGLNPWSTKTCSIAGTPTVKSRAISSQTAERHAMVQRLRSL
jgi:DNA polymerase-1